MNMLYLLDIMIVMILNGMEYYHDMIIYGHQNKIKKFDSIDLFVCCICDKCFIVFKRIYIIEWVRGSNEINNLCKDIQTIIYKTQI